MKIVILYGPPAVGKLTVAKILAEKTGYKLLHNHLLVNPIAEVFPFENPANRLLTREFRLRIIEEAIKSDINMITTFGIAGNNPFEHIRDIVKTSELYKGDVCLVQLTANKEVILSRVEDQSRKLQGKNLTKEKLKQMIIDNPDMFSKYSEKDHLTVDTTNFSPEQTVNTIIKYYTLDNNSLE